MNNDKSLIIVEAAQSPQVVAVSDVSAAEIEYQKMTHAFRETVDQLRVIGKQRITARSHIIQAWLNENYPGRRHTVTTNFVDIAYSDLHYNIEVDVDSPRRFEILQEINEYLAQIEA